MKKKEKKRSRVCSGLDIHIAATSNGSGGPVPVSPGFPTVREPHRPERNRGIEAFGNDELLY